MAEYIASTAQEVAVNQNIIFSDIVVKGNQSILHRNSSGLITLRGLTNGQPRARFKIMFYGNIAIPEDGTIDSISIAIAIDGEPISATTMTVTPSSTLDYFNVANAINIDVPANCCNQISVQNISSQIIEAINSNIIIERIA